MVGHNHFLCDILPVLAGIVVLDSINFVKILFNLVLSKGFKV